MKTLSLKLPSDFNLQLTLAAQRDRLTKSEVVRKALEVYLKDHEQVRKGSFLDLAEDLVGRVEGPDDLSCNPDYLKDLGQ